MWWKCWINQIKEIIIEMEIDEAESSDRSQNKEMNFLNQLGMKKKSNKSP